MLASEFILFATSSIPANDKIQAVIFDCDGVLVDTEYLKFIAWQDALATEDVLLTIEEYMLVIGHSSKKIYRSSEIFQFSKNHKGNKKHWNFMRYMTILRRMN